MSVKLFYDSQCDLGEGLFYANSKLYWFDINKKHFYYCKDDGSHLSQHVFTEQFSTGAVIQNNVLLLVSETGLWCFNTASKVLEKIIDLEADNAVTRSNDGRADRQGGFWIGTMGKQAEMGAGTLYRYYQGKITTLYENISIPNAICFSPSGDYVYFADSKVQIIYRWALDRAGWPKGEPEIWVDLSETTISPDGAVVDKAGFLWNAQWDGSRIVRYTPNGHEDCIVNLPVSRPTCPVFGGRTYSRLFITSAREGLSQEKLALEPYAGGIFSMPLSVSGLPDAKVLLIE